VSINYCTQIQIFKLFFIVPYHYLSKYDKTFFLVIRIYLHHIWFGVAFKPMVEYGYHVHSLFLFKHSPENETTQVTNEISPTHGRMGDILNHIPHAIIPKRQNHIV
jgi:hypothetical protein